MSSLFTENVSTLNKPKARQDSKIPPEVEEQKFLADLTDLSKKYQIGIAGNPALFIMEWDDDGRTYTCDTNGRLFFR